MRTKYIALCNYNNKWKWFVKEKLRSYRVLGRVSWFSLGQGGTRGQKNWVKVILGWSRPLKVLVVVITSRYVAIN